MAMHLEFGINNKSFGRKFFSLFHLLRCSFFPTFNRIKLYYKGVTYGKGLRVYTYMYLNKGNNSEIKIGDNFTFTSSDSINPLCRNIKGCIHTEDNAIIEIGNNVGVSSPCIWAHKKIKIGNHVKIGGDCIILDSDCHSLDYIERRDDNLDRLNKSSQEIIIGNDVLIGCRCIILKGVTIGDRTIIGAGSIVTNSIPEDCIAAGNPCRIIKRIKTCHK